MCRIFLVTSLLTAGEHRHNNTRHLSLSMSSVMLTADHLSCKNTECPFSYYVAPDSPPYCGHFCDETNWQSENQRRLYGTMVMLLQVSEFTYLYVSLTCPSCDLPKGDSPFLKVESRDLQKMWQVIERCKERAQAKIWARADWLFSVCHTDGHHNLLLLPHPEKGLQGHDHSKCSVFAVLDSETKGWRY